MNVLALVVNYKDTEIAERLCQQLLEFYGGAGGGDASSGLNAGFDFFCVQVDNGNQPKVLSAHKHPRYRLLRIEKNHGFAGGVESALALLKGESFSGAFTNGAAPDAVWCLNADLRVDRDCLPRLVKTFKSRPRIGAMGPLVKWGHDTKKDVARGVVNPWSGMTAMVPWPQGGVLPKWSYIPGAAMLISWQAHQELGGFPLRYRMYFEETEFCIQLQKRGWDLVVEANALAYHDVSSLKGAIPGRYYAFYFARNNLYFWKNNFGIPWWLQLPRAAFVVLKELLLPLRRARSRHDLMNRLRYIFGGLFDSVEFLKHNPTSHERVLFADEI